MERAGQASLRRHLSKHLKGVKEEPHGHAEEKPSRGDKCKDPRAGSRLLCSRNSTEASAAGLEGAKRS